ncbi:MAG: helix-turn-helix domain-containing protein [Gemmatimonadetes bacterium]|nr:MAG: helix-turn-helix domain-containing protein [Gemmatimonadota bacterium]
MKTEVAYFNSREAAQILGVNVSSVKRWTDEGKLECIRTLGGHRKFMVRHLLDFLKKHRRKTSQVNLTPIESEADLELRYHMFRRNYEALIPPIYEHAFECHRDQLQQILNELYLSQCPLAEIYGDILTPVLHKIGHEWEQGRISITEEHIATQTIRDSIIRLRGIIQIPTAKIGKVLSLNLSHELHDIALKMTEHLLETKGFEVFYSGQITPTIHLAHVFERYQPDRLYISSTVAKADTTQQELDRLFALCEAHHCEVYVGGTGFDALQYDHPAVIRRIYRFQDI